MKLVKAIKGLFKGAWWLIATIVLASLFVAISFMKVSGVVKGIVHPIYSLTIPNIITIALLFLSLYAFYWFTRKGFVTKRKFLFPTMFGLSASITLLYQMPIFNLISFSSDTLYSTVISESEALKKFRAENIALNNIGYSDQSIHDSIPSISIEELSISALPFYAFKAEIDNNPSSQLFAEQLWKRYYMDLSEVYGEGEPLMDAYESAYHNAMSVHFKTYRNDDSDKSDQEKGKRVLLVMANMYKYGIGVEKSPEKANVIYGMLARSGAKHAKYLHKMEKPASENKTSIDDYFYLRVK